jgi:predicted RNase H-like nuclease (RuvC/YqgF family)
MRNLPLLLLCLAACGCGDARKVQTLEQTIKILETENKGLRIKLKTQSTQPIEKKQRDDLEEMFRKTVVDREQLAQFVGFLSEPECNNEDLFKRNDYLKKRLDEINKEQELELQGKLTCKSVIEALIEKGKGGARGQ